MDLSVTHVWLVMSAPVVIVFAMRLAIRQTAHDALVSVDARVLGGAMLYATGGLLAVAGAPSTRDALGLLLFLASLGYLATFDLRTLTVPLAPIAAMIVTGIAFSSMDGWQAVLEHAFAAAAGWAGFRLLALSYNAIRGRSGLGAGDAWIAALIGSWLSFEGLAWAVALAGATLLAWRLFTQKRLVNDAAAFAPGLAVGALCVTLVTSSGLSP